MTPPSSAPGFRGTTIDLADGQNRSHDNHVRLLVREATAEPAGIVNAACNLGTANNNRAEIRREAAAPGSSRTPA